jgi:hypothetical protein
MRLSQEQRGAALIEFVIAFSPMLMIFFSFVQAAQLAKAKLITRHAAVAATRAAIVTYDHSGGAANNPGDNGNDDDYKAAAGIAMGTYLEDGNLANPTTTCEKPDAADPFGLVTCTVEVTYNCDVPLGKYIVCGGRTMQLKALMSLPHQGARYK